MLEVPPERIDQFLNTLPLPDATKATVKQALTQKQAEPPQTSSIFGRMFSTTKEHVASNLLTLAKQQVMKDPKLTSAQKETLCHLLVDSDVTQLFNTTFPSSTTSSKTPMEVEEADKSPAPTTPQDKIIALIAEQISTEHANNLSAAIKSIKDPSSLQRLEMSIHKLTSQKHLLEFIIQELAFLVSDGPGIECLLRNGYIDTLGRTSAEVAMNAPGKLLMEFHYRNRHPNVVASILQFRKEQWETGNQCGPDPTQPPTSDGDSLEEKARKQGDVEMLVIIHRTDPTVWSGSEGNPGDIDSD